MGGIAEIHVMKSFAHFVGMTTQQHQSKPSTHGTAGGGGGGMRIVIPGDPVAQGRPRFYRAGKGVRAVDPEKSRNWKAEAQWHMQKACDEAGFDPVPAKVPVELTVVVKFRCPTSDYRKRNPRETRWHTKRPDLDNVIKAVKDAGTGILWIDDSQVVVIHASKVIADQGAPPGVVVNVIRKGMDP